MGCAPMARREPRLPGRAPAQEIMPRTRRARRWQTEERRREKPCAGKTGGGPGASAPRDRARVCHGAGAHRPAVCRPFRFDPAASSRGARAGTVNPEGGETAFARQVIRATLAADARALAERADGKPVPGGPLPFILPEMPRGFVSGPARRLAVVRARHAVPGLAGSPYRVRAPPATIA